MHNIASVWFVEGLWSESGFVSKRIAQYVTV